jgi:hypothetical protein
MAEPQMTPENGAVVLALYAIARIVETFMKQLIGLFKRKNAEDKQAREDERAEAAEREQWAAINLLKEKHAEHEKEDASAFATVHAEQKHQSAILHEIKADVKQVLRRSTGKHND